MKSRALFIIIFYMQNGCVRIHYEEVWLSMLLQYPAKSALLQFIVDSGRVINAKAGIQVHALIASPKSTTTQEVKYTCIYNTEIERHFSWSVGDQRQWGLLIWD